MSKMSHDRHVIVIVSVWQMLNYINRTLIIIQYDGIFYNFICIYKKFLIVNFKYSFRKKISMQVILNSGELIL